MIKCFPKPHSRGPRGPYEKHDASLSSEYNTWKNIRARCHRLTNPHYYRYGARGITVCDRWLKSFNAFLADMGQKPAPEYTIERKNNNRGYTKRNCKWALRKERQRNRRCTRWTRLDGKRVKVADLADKCGMASTTLWLRLRAGWDIARAMSTPLKDNGRRAA